MKQSNKRVERIYEKKQYLLDTRSMPIRQYLLDKILPSLTEGLIQFTDKIDFTKVDAADLDNKLIDEDPLDFLVRDCPLNYCRLSTLR